VAEKIGAGKSGDGTLPMQEGIGWGLWVTLHLISAILSKLNQ